jgi:hypothetical protein
MTRTGHWRSMLARSARPWAVLLSCLLLAAQWVLLTHDHADGHADDHAPSQHAAHGCDLCVAFAAAAPAPAPAAGLALPPAVAPLPPVVAVTVSSRFESGAHRSRAPPAFRSA